MTWLSKLTALTLLVIAGFHMMWGFGVTWPAGNEAVLARTVTGFPGAPVMPPAAACFFVTLCLSIAAFIALAIGGVLSVPVPKWLIIIAAGVVAFVFLSRGIIGFLPFWPDITPEEPFRTLDRRFYSPLCLALGAALIVMIVQALQRRV